MDLAFSVNCHTPGIGEVASHCRAASDATGMAPVLIEHLHSVVAIISYEDPTIGIEAYPTRIAELALTDEGEVFPLDAELGCIQAVPSTTVPSTTAGLFMRFIRRCRSHLPLSYFVDVRRPYTTTTTSTKKEQA